MNIDGYLRRIGLTERPPATLDGLRAVHRAHLLAIPFEDIDVQLGHAIAIDTASIYTKIVERRRGGWCYEMNGLLGWALGELGFNVTRATGAVGREFRDDSSIGNHLVLRVDLAGETWLADVGFGDGPRDPVKLRPGKFEAAGFDFKLDKLDSRWWRLTNRPNSSFDFNLDPADENLLAEKCAFLQTAPDSPFVQNLVAQRHVPHGIEVLRGRVHWTFYSDHLTERTIDTADDLVATLKTVFALDVPEAASLWPKIIARHEDLLVQKAARTPPQ